jgi:tyrosyl-tRNA synthetase
MPNSIIVEVIDEVGYDKAVKELVKRGICISRAEARRQINYVKINNGDKSVKKFRVHK